MLTNSEMEGAGGFLATGRQALSFVAPKERVGCWVCLRHSGCRLRGWPGGLWRPAPCVGGAGDQKAPFFWNVIPFLRW